VEDMDVVTEGAATANPELAQIEAAVSRATQALLATQRADGHFVFELEADVSIPAEYIFFTTFLGSLPTPSLKARSQPLSGANRRRMMAGHCH